MRFSGERRQARIEQVAPDTSEGEGAFPRRASLFYINLTFFMLDNIHFQIELRRQFQITTRLFIQTCERAEN